MDTGNRFLVKQEIRKKRNTDYWGSWYWSGYEI